MKKTKSDRKKELGIAVIIVTAVFVLMWIMRPWKTRPTFDAVKSSVGQEEQIRRMLDGVFVEKGKENLPIVGVMIENMIEAQPLSGIADAALVFEAVAEANITRFLAYFVLSSPPESSPIKGEEQKGNSPPLVGGVRGGGDIEIGPVRSARPYYLDFAAEFNTLYGHVGSSPAAYELLRKKGGMEGVRDLDQWYNDQYFFSKVGRPKPHHLYTSMELLGKAYKDFTPPLSPPYQGGDTVGVWQFKNDASPDLRGDVDEISVGYTAPYEVSWVYDKFENRYRRMQWGGPDGIHKDASGKEIIAENIAVAFMKMKVLDEIGRKEFMTTSEGKGLVFQDGRVVVGTWRKPSGRERLRFYDGQGNEVAFNAGTTWVEIVPDGYEVKY